MQPLFIHYATLPSTLPPSTSNDEYTQWGWSKRKGASLRMAHSAYGVPPGVFKLWPIRPETYIEAMRAAW
jgi:hypothetical protein